MPSDDIAHPAPVAVVTWAKVSAEADQRLSEQAGQGPIRLRPDEWASGDIWWLIDAVGDARGIEAAMQALMAGPFKDREVKVAVRDSSGRVTADLLSSHVRQRSEPEGGTA